LRWGTALDAGTFGLQRLDDLDDLEEFDVLDDLPREI
jgi:hypothetical protein